jgi:hypothetical protein
MTYTPKQLHYLKHTMGVVPVGNPYARHANDKFASCRDVQAYEARETHEHYAEQRRSDAVRFEDLYSDREIGLWADLQFFKSRSEHLEATIAEACKVLGSHNLVEAVRKLKDELREAKKPIAEQADKE